jgi:hypothetical protein
MKIEPKANCPLDGFKPCRQLECAWFMKVQGTDPQSGKEVDEWGCSMAWLPVMMIENSRQQHQTGAAVESFRNEMVKANEVGQRVLLAAAGVQPAAQTMILENK